MRGLIQRVTEASVRVEGRVTGSIGCGLLVLAGIAPDDSDEDGQWLARKIVGLRIFADETGTMNRCVRDIEGSILAISQFTLFASTRKGNRPSWSGAAPPAVAEPAFGSFVESLAQHLGRPVPTGVFGADMKVTLVNDGPVTVWLDSRERDY